jgi:uncharacterized protein (DUF58 family)
MSITTGAVFLAAVVAVSALWLPAPLAVAAFIMVLAAALTDAWQVRAPVPVETYCPTILSRGIPARLSVTPTSAVRRIRIHQPATLDVLIEPQQEDGALQSAITALRRGRHLLPAPATRAVGPLGLGVWYHRTGSARQVVVYPDMPAARRLAQQVRTGRFREEGRRSRGPLGLGTELESIRQYLPDDDIRQLNWRATARLGIPMSNTYRVDQDRELVCVLDTGRLMASPVGDRTRLDAAVDAVAAVAAVADAIGDRIGLVAFADGIRRQLSPRRAGGDDVIRAIYDLEPQPVDSDYVLAFRTVGGSKRAFILILTDIVEEAAAAPLVEAMAILARHHSVAVATLVDDDITGMFHQPPATVTDVYRMAMAVEVSEAREVVSKKLTRHGAAVIDAPLDSFSVACVGAYLRAKAAARI